MVESEATLDAKAVAAAAVDDYREDLPTLRRLIAVLDGQRPNLGSMGDEWLTRYDHHSRVLDEIYGLTQQGRLSRFGKRRRRVVREEVNALRSLLADD